MRVRFTRHFDWRPHPRQVIAYRAGMVLPVTRRCAEKAIAAGAAEKVGRTRKQPTASKEADNG